MARTITVTVQSTLDGFKVVSPKGGIREIAGAPLFYGDAFDSSLHDALVIAVRANGEGSLTLDQMIRISEIGRVVQPKTRKLERIEAGTMVPTMDGDYREETIEKHAFQCLGCGLVWSREWHAETCGDRNHVAVWQQRYVSGPIVNGRPSAERFYPRVALRREPIEAAA